MRLNERPFRKREGSRATLFAQLDRPALQPLRATRLQLGEWETARVNIDYHVEVERHFYSVPYALVLRHEEMALLLGGIDLAGSRRRAWFRKIVGDESTTSQTVENA